MKAEPSRTAWRAAHYRAAHQLLEGGAIFFDPLAVPLLGEDPQKMLRETVERPDQRLLRLFIAARSRFAEDCLANAVDRGIRQTVVLGAGLDTFGLRNPYVCKNLQVYEVDHPATQARKRDLIARAKLDMPESLHFVAADFEQHGMMTKLVEAGFRSDEPAFFIWLGVVTYLTRKAISESLAAIAAVPAGEVVLDYGEPRETFPEEGRLWLDNRMARSAAAGEPWLTFFTPDDLAAELLAKGFAETQDLGLGKLAARYFREVPIPIGLGAAHVVHARCRLGERRGG
jgi:methyltransferase (TIGR00027 family)